MRTDPQLSRRTLLIAAAAGTAALNMRTVAAQAAARGGDWLAMIKEHHQLVAKTFDRTLSSQGKTFLQRDMLQKALAYELTAHSVGEENVIYPALARSGLLSESDRLYLDQAHAKVMNAELDLTAEQNESAWFDKVRALQAAVLKHAQQDEEGNIYPMLKSKLDGQTNGMLSQMYQREFDRVKAKV